MRENQRFVLFPARHTLLATLLAAAFALVLAVLPAGALGASPFGPLAEHSPAGSPKTTAEPAPEIVKPVDQSGVRGKPVVLIVKGSNLASLKAKGLPAGVETLVKVTETEWKIEGTPTAAQPATEVTLEAENKEAAAATPVGFKWTVTEPEPAPVISKPAGQGSVRGKPVVVVVKGSNLASLKAKGLPAGVETLVKVTETEWKIEGTPTAAQPATEVTLEAENKEAAAATPVGFKWTVTEPEPVPTIEKPADPNSTEGVAIAPLIIRGTHLFSLKAKGLPAGIEQPVKKSQTEWEITGTPTTRQSATAVTLEAQNEEGATQTQTFNWTVHEAQPTINKPPDQITQEGKPITPVIVTGTKLALLKAKALPAGLKLVKKNETEWEISGTPTAAKAETKVTLEAQNKEEGPLVTQQFAWTVTELEPQPTIEKPSDQTGVAGAPIAPLIVRGTRLAALTAKALPAGLTLTELNEQEWEVAGTPTTAQPASEVVLEAHNKEGRSSAVRAFNWTVIAVGPTPSGTLTVSPGVVFSASRASCGGVRWPVTAVGTQWLLDGAPLAGATAATYVPPRADDGHRLACRQTATGANGVATTVTSTAHVVYEQPAQPSWPIAAAAQRCRTAVCMFDGGAVPVQSAQSYAQGGQWLGARQVRCASAPWTSQAGDSAVAAIHGLAAAHAVRVSLQRITAAGTVTIISAQAGPLPEGSASGIGGTFAVPFGAQPFVAGEIWTRLQAAATGTPNWFAAGAGALLYSASGRSGVLRSFQLVYNLTRADLGATLRCVAGADDGPAGAPTRATGASPEYRVASSSSCAPRRLGAASGPQPALVEPGRTPCLLAPAGPAALEGNQAAIGVAKGRAAIALACALSSCRGTLSLVAGSVTAARANIALGGGRSGLVRVPLSGAGRRLLAQGAVVAVTLKLRGTSRNLGAARLVKMG